MRIEIKSVKKIPFEGYRVETTLHFKPWFKKEYSVDKTYMSRGGVVWYDYETCERLPINVVSNTLENHISKLDILRLKKTVGAYK